MNMELKNNNDWFTEKDIEDLLILIRFPIFAALWTILLVNVFK